VALIVVALPCRAAWNNPYPAADARKNILYSAFRERPKHLDPARAYSSNEYEFIAQIYEPPFQYHYLKRPYQLVPLTAQSVPTPMFLDRHGRRLPPSARVEQIAFSTYEIRIRPGIRYQPHAAFARGGDGRLLYATLAADSIAAHRSIADFPETGTRELTAADYVYQIKRLAHPKLHSPILSVMQDYIVGLKEYAALLRQEYAHLSAGGERGVYLDLARYPLAGVEEMDRYTYRITIHGKYPQFLYWMAMPFFAPMAPEVDRFFSQAGMADNNLSLDWYPVGTGAYMLTVNDPNRKMVLERNPNYHEERYPDEGEEGDVQGCTSPGARGDAQGSASPGPRGTRGSSAGTSGCAAGDAAAGLLRDAGQRLPFIERVEFSLEKESIPYWNKFLQGYYDRSGVLSESFDQAVRFTGSGDTELTDAMKDKGIRLQTSVATSTYYLGFNMLDSVVGGLSERARKLRQAVSIAIDYEEQISIFRNGRGIAAQGPLPPGIFGHREGRAGINPYVYDWVDGKPRRKPIEYARKLLAEAGYPDGQDASGAPLVLHFETPATGPEEKAQLDWMRKQLAKLNVQLVVRATDYNRFQEKMRKGDAQLFVWGWNADYPDPENFLFLLYGPNKKVGGEGENAANYDNPAFNRLFEQMKNMDNSPERLAIIDEMLDIARRDAPWAWGVHPKQFVLMHAWVSNDKPNHMANNTLKYLRLDPDKRAASREAWNQPVLWPVAVLLAVLTASLVPAVITYRRREKGVAR
jgi:ABC-type transport system substrate-binding protein